MAPATPDNEWSWWKDNSTVIIAILSVVIVAIRLLGVARGDPEIAFAILQIGGTGTVLIATLISTLGLLAIPACAVLAYNAWLKKDSVIQRWILIASSFGMFTIALYMAPAFLLVASIPGLILIIILSVKTTTTGAQYLTGFIVIYIIVLFIYGLFSPTPWLPVQEINIPGQKPFTGYVLSQTSGAPSSILTSSPEEVISVPSRIILVTEQCTPPLYQWEQATLFDLLEHSEHKLVTYPTCPSTSYSPRSS